MNKLIIPPETGKTTFDRNEEPRSLAYLDACADARNRTGDVLASGIELFRSIVDDPEADPLERYNAAERFRAFSEEIARRDRVARTPPGAAMERDLDHHAWLQLARTVRERAEVPEILALAGVPMRRAGTSRGRDEWAGPCPACGTGDDRLRAWSGPDGRLWCRRCEWSGDVISAASLIVRTGNFRDCVRFLADHAGLPIPEPCPGQTTRRKDCSSFPAP